MTYSQKVRILWVLVALVPVIMIACAVEAFHGAAVLAAVSATASQEWSTQAVRFLIGAPVLAVLLVVFVKLVVLADVDDASSSDRGQS